MAQPRTGFCLPWNSPELRRVYELAEFSGGQAIFSNKPPADFAGSAMRQVRRGGREGFERKPRCSNSCRPPLRNQKSTIAAIVIAPTRVAPMCPSTRTRPLSRSACTATTPTFSSTHPTVGFGRGKELNRGRNQFSGQLWQPVSLVEQRTAVVRQVIARKLIYFLIL
jgi:hypothetical protein